MDVSTRPSATRHQKMSLQKRLLVAFTFLAAMGLGPLSGYSASTQTEAENTEPDAVASIASTGTHEISIRIVKQGEETLSLAARLTDLSPNLAANVSWQIRNDQGELIADETTTELTKSLPPGDYIVEANYGTVQLRESLALPKGNSIAVNFVLNAGGLRVLPGLKGLPSIELDNHTLVYALSGPLKGKLIAHSSTPGEIFKLAAGQYRVESRFGGGNSVAVADVRVRPGRMSAVEVKHSGGLARLSFVGSPAAKVKWDIKESDGHIVASLEGLEHRLALKPGTYRAEAHVDGEVLMAQFKIGAGEERDILLGN